MLTRAAMGMVKYLIVSERPPKVKQRGPWACVHGVRGRNGNASMLLRGPMGAALIIT